MRNEYLINTDFVIYKSGIYDGILRFTEKNIQISRIDKKTRVQLGFEEYKSNNKPYKLDFYNKIFRNINFFNKTKWEEDKVILQNGDVYNKYISFTDEINGKEVISELWIEKNSYDVMDIITVDKKIVAFISPSRTTTEILVMKDYRKVTLDLNWRNVLGL